MISWHRELLYQSFQMSSTVWETEARCLLLMSSITWVNPSSTRFSLLRAITMMAKEQRLAAVFEHADCQTSWANQTWLHCAFGASMYLLLGLMTLMGICNRILAVLASRAAAKGEIPPTSSRLYTWYRRDIGTPAMMGYRHVQAWGILSIPTRPQSLMVSHHHG